MSLGSLGSLNVLLSADTAQFSSAMEKAAYQAEREMQRISRSAKINSAIMTAAMVAAATAFTAKMKQIIDRADDMNKMSQKLGLTVEQLSKLQYAAEISGVSIEELNTAFARLNKSAFDGAIIFKGLGISVKDSNGNMKNGNDILLEVADRFSRMKDGVGKAAAAQELFGRSGVQLIPLLNQGRDGLKALGDEAERLGIVMDSKTSQSAENFNDNLTRIARNIDGMFFSIGSGLIPALEGLSQNLINTSEKAELLRAGGKALAQVLIIIANGAMTASQMIETAGKTIGDFAAVLTLAASGDFKNAMQTMADSSKETNERWAQLSQDVQKNWDLIAESAEDSVTRTTNAMSGPMFEFTKDMEIAAKRVEDLGKGIGNAFGKAFEDAIIEGKRFKDVIVGLLQDIERAALRSMITQPLVDAISGGVSSFFGPGKASNITKTVTVSKYGNVLSNGSVIPFASGGIIGSPVMFPMSGGRRGLAGEAGKEAILPLTRTSSGDLGVKSAGGGRTEVNIYAPAGSNVTSDRQQDGDMEKINIYIDDAMAGNISRPGSKTFRSLKNTFGLGPTLTKR